MKKFPLLLLIVSACFFACNSNSHADVDKSLETFSDGNTAFPAVTDSVSANAEAIPDAPAEAYTAANLNPPHGQPGHDCSVAVGAPLNKAAAVATPAAPAPVPAPSPVQTTKLNPPHGQPGHVCEIPVGQPLP